MKYIIEFEDEYSMNEGGMKYHQCKQVPYWSVSHGIIKNLTPYTEPDRKDIEDEVWEFVRKCLMMDGSDFVEIFDSYSYINLLEYSYQEAKTKFEAWKKKMDETIHCGDEIISEEDDVKAIMLDCADYESIYVLTEHGCVERWKDLDGVKKTGRHFPEVAELLRKMRGEEQ